MDFHTPFEYGRLFSVAQKANTLNKLPVNCEREENSNCSVQF